MYVYEDRKWTKFKKIIEKMSEEGVELNSKTKSTINHILQSMYSK
jgi:predicted transcriptional regulator